MLTFEVNKQEPVSISSSWLKKIAESFAQENKLTGQWHFSLAFVDNKTIRKFNRLYRGQDCATDVLSFSEENNKFGNLTEEKKYLGEIIISVSQAKKQARELGCSLPNEVARLLVHGLAHLAGYDHEGQDPKNARKMLKLEKRVLIKLKIWPIFKFEEEETLRITFLQNLK